MDSTTPLNHQDLFAISQRESKEFVEACFKAQPQLFEALRCAMISNPAQSLKPDLIENQLKIESKRCFKEISRVAQDKQAGLQLLLLSVIITSRWIPNISYNNITDRFDCVSYVIDQVRNGEELPSVFNPETVPIEKSESDLKL